MTTITIMPGIRQIIHPNTGSDLPSKAIIRPAKADSEAESTDNTKEAGIAFKFAYIAIAGIAESLEKEQRAVKVCGRVCWTIGEVVAAMLAGEFVD